jgi:hypothetical protein
VRALAAHLVALLVALLLGGVVAVSAVAVHRQVADGLPWGVVLAVVASVAVGWGARRVWPARPTLASAYGLGWLVVFGLALVGRPEGDYAIAADARGYLLIGAALVMVAVTVGALAWSRPR